MVKNNVTRMLSSRNIPFAVYELPAKKVGALETASILGIDPEIVYKTIVVTPQGKGKPLLAVVPATADVDLKLIAVLVKIKKAVLPTQKEAESITGLQAGGISPLALLNKGFEIVLDISALDYEEMHISGGQIGLNIRLPVKDFIQFTNARTALIRKMYS